MTIVLGQYSVLFLDCNNSIIGNSIKGKFHDSIFDDVEINDHDITDLDLSHKSINNLTIRNSNLYDVKLNDSILNNISIFDTIICTASLNNTRFSSGVIRNLCLINTSAQDLYFTFEFDVLEIEYAHIKPSFALGSQIIKLINKKPHQCFHKDTYVSTKIGYRKMKNLRIGTILDKNQVVKHISKHKINKYITMIKIPKHSLGKAQPNRELLVTPLHYIFLNGEYINAYLSIGVNNITAIKIYIDYLVNLTLCNKYESFIANGAFSISDGHENAKVDYCFPIRTL